jgi:hypothetical protein
MDAHGIKMYIEKQQRNGDIWNFSENITSTKSKSTQTNIVEEELLSPKMRVTIS